MLAVSRQTLNQAPKDFEAQGSIRLAYGEIELVDIPALRARGQVRTSIFPPKDA